MKPIRQFEIYEVDLEPRKGSEQGGRRPCLILQTNASAYVAQTFLVAPLTGSQLQRIPQNHVLVLQSAANGLNKDSKIKLDQIRVVDRSRLAKRLGGLEADYIPAVFQSIDVMIDRFGDFR